MKPPVLADLVLQHQTALHLVSPASEQWIVIKHAHKRHSVIGAISGMLMVLLARVKDRLHCAGPEQEQADATDEERDGQDATPEMASAPPTEETEAACMPECSTAEGADRNGQERSSAQLAAKTSEHLSQQQPEQAAAAQQCPQPWPLLPMRVTDTAGKLPVASDQPKRPPSNLVTSWGPSAPGKRILAHTAPRPPGTTGALDILVRSPCECTPAVRYSVDHVMVAFCGCTVQASILIARHQVENS